jgi:glutathione S-transferase
MGEGNTLIQYLPQGAYLSIGKHPATSDVEVQSSPTLQEASMKLYYAPGHCSLSPHIALREAGLPFTLELVDIQARTVPSGRDYRQINGKNYVPALELDDGQVLTEGPAIIQYVADQAPQASLAPAPGTMERYRLQEWLNFIATEVHKALASMFNPAQSPE